MHTHTHSHSHTHTHEHPGAGTFRENEAPRRLLTLPWEAGEASWRQ